MTHRDHKKRRMFVWVAVFFFATFTMLSFWGAWFAYSVVKALPDPERITDRTIAQSTKIYDRTGTVLLYEIHGEEKRTLIPLQDIPDAVRHATLAAEDIHFYQHGALDFRGIIRAFLVNLLHRDVTQGGSTITQQLVKNSILTSERTYTRKIKEAILSFLIEKKYSKDEILGLYLNQIPYGSNAYGIAAAADTYFNKQVKDLNISEAALLSALPKAPTYYSPYGNHKDELLKRRDWILTRMEQAGFISHDQDQDAKRAQISFAPAKHGIKAPHFVMYVRNYLNEKYGEQFVEGGGLRVISTLDWQLQQMAEKTVGDGAERNKKLVNAKNAAMVVIDPRTGDILAMVGSRDYFDLSNDGNVNVTTRPRQPGSAFKPFVYATAFQKGYTPETVLFDVPTEFNVNCNSDGTPGPGVRDPKDCYHPRNYDEKFRGPIDLRHALAQSLNVPSVKLLYLAGDNDSIITAKNMGITTLTDPKRYGLSLVLGGAEVTLLEMASAFGAFAQDGVLHPKTAILRIEKSEGVILEEKMDSSIPALDTEIARTINNILSDNDARVPVFNPRSSLYFPNRNVAAKTGTTQDYHDAWTIGYTPSIVVGVWVGNNDNTPMTQNGLSVMVAAPIWHAAMEYILKYTPPGDDFIPPQKQTATNPIFRGIYRSGEIVKIDKISRKLATALTPPELIEEVGVGDIRSILASIDKNNPTGDPPRDPMGDLQYANWQAGIDRWLTLNPLSTIEKPSEYDDVHTPESIPHVAITSPDKDTLSRNELNHITITTNSRFPLQEIQLFVNDGLINSKTKPIPSGDITFNIDFPSPQEIITLKVVVYDEKGNKTSVEKTVRVTN